MPQEAGLYRPQQGPVSSGFNEASEGLPSGETGWLLFLCLLPGSLGLLTPLTAGLSPGSGTCVLLSHSQGQVVPPNTALSLEVSLHTVPTFVKSTESC